MLRRFGWVLGCGISVIAVLLGRPALAAVPLEWEAPAECPQAAEVVRESGEYGFVRFIVAP